jgi:replication initiation protein RepC
VTSPSPSGRDQADAGGYLRDLTRRAEAGEFSLGPMLMALIGARKRRPNEKMTA